MTPEDAPAATPDATPRRGFWALLAVSVLATIAAVFPVARDAAAFVLTSPARLASALLPGSDFYGDARAAGHIAQWLGWAGAGLLVAPLVAMALIGAGRLAGPLEKIAFAYDRAARRPRFRFFALAGLGALALGFVLAASGWLGVWGAPVAPERPPRWSAALITLIVYLAAAPVLHPRARTPLEAHLMASARLVDWVMARLAGAVAWATLALVAVVMIIVVQRYVFGVAFTKLQELVTYLHAGVFMLCAAATLRADGHVRVDIFYGSLGERGRAIVDLAGAYLFLTPMCLVLLHASGGDVDLAWRIQEGSRQPDGVRLVYLLKTLVPVFAAMMLAQAVAIAAHAALVLAGAEHSQARGHDEQL